MLSSTEGKLCRAFMLGAPGRFVDFFLQLFNTLRLE